MMMRHRATFRPFAQRDRGAILAILLTFALFSTLGILLSIRATHRSRHRAVVVEMAARQRTLAQRYVTQILLVRAGRRADPGPTASLLERSGWALLDGGLAPGVGGDDDETELPPEHDKVVRGQLKQELRLVHDLTATGSAFLANRSVMTIHLSAGERIAAKDPIDRLRVLSALTSNVSLNAARTIADQADRKIGSLIVLQAVLGGSGLLVSILLGWALITAARRQTARFQSLVAASTDLVLVFGEGGCRYASRSVAAMLGRSESDVLGGGLDRHVHADDLPMLRSAWMHCEPPELRFRVVNGFGEWQHLEAVVTDMRADRRVRGVVLNARDISERVQLEEELTRQAFHDGLTGLANRALFRDRLDQALARAGRTGAPLAVLLVDLDGFKQVNDSLGHDAGDELLRQVATRFLEVMRPGDTLARLGGDEFAVLLEGVGQETAVSVARRFLERLERAARIAEREIPVSASIGIVVHEGGDASSEDLVRHADLAMYAAKEAGRARYELFRYDMARELGELIGLEHELRLGLQRGEFSVFYQPEVDLKTDEIAGVEALARWQSPTRGLVPADRFIALAESTGLIGQLGEVVLREACRQTAAWREEDLLPAGFVTWVNVSGKQLSAGGLDALVRHVLDETGLPPSALGLEVTETAIVAEGVPGDRARSELQELHELGVRIAIDDFGTGFSSLGHLRRFPVDVIKVDRSFVQGMADDQKSAAITANLARLASALGLVAVAEGIESDAQLVSVRALGCGLGQGYLFARPMPAADMQAALRAAADGLRDLRAASA